MVFSFRETISKLRTIHIAKKNLLSAAGRPNGYIHFGRYAAQYAEIGINVIFDW